jgi:hypothetical protein
VTSFGTAQVPSVRSVEDSEYTRYDAREAGEDLQDRENPKVYEQPRRRHVAVVMFYGPKPDALHDIVTVIQSLAVESLPFDTFTPRPLPEVHSTLISLEAHVDHERLTSRFWPSAADDAPEMRIGGLLAHLRCSIADLRLSLQVGGFDDIEYSFRSRGERLYKRSLTAQNGQLLLAGWPVDHGAPTAVLDRLRRSCQKFGVGHKYHPTPDALDPDAHLVIGDYVKDLPVSRLESLLAVGLGALKLNNRPFPVTIHDVSVVAFTKMSLPASNTSRLPLATTGEKDVLDALKPNVPDA